MTAPVAVTSEHRDLREQGGHRGRAARARAVRRRGGGADARREGARHRARRHRRRHDGARGLSPRLDRPHGRHPDRRRPLHQRPRRRPPGPDHRRRAAQEEVRLARSRSAVGEDEMVEVPMVGRPRAEALPAHDARRRSCSRGPRSCSAWSARTSQRLGLEKEIRSGDRPDGRRRGARGARRGRREHLRGAGAARRPRRASAAWWTSCRAPSGRRRRVSSSTATATSRAGGAGGRPFADHGFGGASFSENSSRARGDENSARGRDAASMIEFVGDEKRIGSRSSWKEATPRPRRSRSSGSAAAAPTPSTA